MVERDRPVRARTVLRRMIRSGSDITACTSLVLVDFCWTDRTNPCRRQIRFVVSATYGAETAANRHALDPNAPPFTDAMAEGEFRAQAATRLHVDAKLAFAICQQGFELRIAFEALGHIGHGRAR